MPQTLPKLRQTLKNHADKEKAASLCGFFKTGPGQYGEGDVFLGITLPIQRLIAKEFADLPLKDIQILLKSPIHEERLTALLILVGQYKQGNEQTKEKIYLFYLKNAARVNNWDLVDSSAHHIVGAHLEGKSYEILVKLAGSKLLWERRIAMVATWYHIRKGRPEPALTIAKLLLKDEHDLMHKAVGWMLREVGKHVSKEELVKFLRANQTIMPRTALRYAIEHFSPQQRALFLAGTF
jgi:3-methyladenine DNA glycosylase AlkD